VGRGGQHTPTLPAPEVTHKVAAYLWQPHSHPILANNITAPTRVSKIPLTVNVGDQSISLVRPSELVGGGQVNGLALAKDAARHGHDVFFGPADSTAYPSNVQCQPVLVCYSTS
jgi:hypothetical protein